MIEFIRRKITKDESRDTGMAIVLMLMIAFLAWKRKEILAVAMAAQVINMTMPTVFRPFAVVWLGISDLLSTVVSKILMSIVYFGVVTPLGIIRRLSGKDSLNLRVFHRSEESVMVVRNQKFIARDLERPY